MLSIIITTKDSYETFEKSFRATLASVKDAVNQKIIIDAQIIVVSVNTYHFLDEIHEEHIQISNVIDSLEGKSIAMNLGIEQSRGEYCIFTDGDILLDIHAIGSLYHYATNQSLVIAGGKPQSIETKNTMLGYWSWALAEGNAARIRKQVERDRLSGNKKFFPVSGYLFIITKDAFPLLPKDLLSEDAYISYKIFEKGNAIGYCEDALVYVKYPQTYHDYLAQKVRSTGGYAQQQLKNTKTRSFSYEALHGAWATLTYAKNPTQLWWSCLLLLSRIHIWILILYKVKIRKQTNIWDTIHSSKI
jgi:cellulose synthase/poly-beta-1,6-N-acetylglucosamine synthase-like glycosyltransferase